MDLSHLPKHKRFPWLTGNIPEHQTWLRTPNPADTTDGNSVFQEIGQLGEKRKREKCRQATERQQQSPPACQIPTAHPFPCWAKQNPKPSGKHWDDVSLVSAFTLREEVAWAQLNPNFCSTAEEAAPHCRSNNTALRPCKQEASKQKEFQVNYLKEYGWSGTTALREKCLEVKFPFGGLFHCPVHIFSVALKHLCICCWENTDFWRDIL